jgi:hypothetical protein
MAKMGGGRPRAMAPTKLVKPEKPLAPAPDVDPAAGRRGAERLHPAGQRRGRRHGVGVPDFLNGGERPYPDQLQGQDHPEQPGGANLGPAAAGGFRALSAGHRWLCCSCCPGQARAHLLPPVPPLVVGPLRPGRLQGHRLCQQRRARRGSRPSDEVRPIWNANSPNSVSKRP